MKRPKAQRADAFSRHGLRAFVVYYLKLFLDFYLKERYNNKRSIDVSNVREWLSGRASPCQGEGRGFKSRLALNKSAPDFRGFFLCKLPFSTFCNVGVCNVGVSIVSLALVCTELHSYLKQCAKKKTPQCYKGVLHSITFSTLPIQKQYVSATRPYQGNRNIRLLA